MKKSLMSFVALILISILLIGCQNAAPALPKPAADKGNVTGRIVSVNTGEPYGDTFVWMADVYRNADGGGAYALDTSTTLHTTTDSDGNYSFSNIEPGEYVLVFGDPMTRYYIVANADHKPRIWTVTSGGTLDIGKLEIDLD